MNIKLFFFLFSLVSFVYCINYPIHWTYSSVPYATINATTVDTVTFTFVSPHTVYLFPNFTAYTNCDFSNATALATSKTDSPYVIKTDTVGTFYYGCIYPYHCTNYNMKIQVNVVQAVTTSVPQVTTMAQLSTSHSITGSSRSTTGSSQLTGSNQLTTGSSQLTGSNQSTTGVAPASDASALYASLYAFFLALFLLF